MPHAQLYSTASSTLEPHSTVSPGSLVAARLRFCSGNIVPSGAAIEEDGIRNLTLSALPVSSITGFYSCRPRGSLLQWRTDAPERDDVVPWRE